MLTARFHRAIQILSRLEHRNLVKAFEAGQQGDAHYLVMEYVDGQDLRSVLKEKGPLGVEDAVRYTIQAAAGLAAAHQQGIAIGTSSPATCSWTAGRDQGGRVHAGPRRGRRRGRRGGRRGQPDAAGPGDGHLRVHVARAGDGQQQRRSPCGHLQSGLPLYTLLTGRPPYVTKPGMQQVMAHRAQPIPSLRGAARGARGRGSRVSENDGQVARRPLRLDGRGHGRLGGRFDGASPLRQPPRPRPRRARQLRSICGP